MGKIMKFLGRVLPPKKPEFNPPQSLPALLFTPTDLEIGAKTLWGEARGQPYEGLIAVAWTIRNRVERGGWWGDTVTEVCRYPFQFSCWNTKDPNRQKILKIKPDTPHYQTCVEVMRLVLMGQVADPTMGATHYHTLKVKPKWSKGKTPCVVIGDHAFFNDIE